MPMPCKCTRKVVEKAIELKASGLADVDICRALGMSQSAFYRWIQIGSDESGQYDGDKNIRLKRALVEGLKKAEAEYKQRLLDTIMDAAMEKSGNWTAAAWLLERKYPNEFGKSERRFDEGKTDTPTIVLGVPVAVIQKDAPIEADFEVVDGARGDGRGGIAPEIEARDGASLPGANQGEML